MSAFDSRDPPKPARAMTTTSGVEVLVNDPLVPAPPAPARPKPNQAESAYIQKLEKKWGRFIRMKLHRPDVNAASVEELTHEILLTFLREHRKPEEEAIEHEQAYLDKVILNQIHKHAREKRPVADGSDADQQAISAPGPHSALEAAERKRLLQEHLDKLPKEQREVFEARELEEMSFEAIALMVGRPRDTVVDQFKRAKHKLERSLRAAMNQEGGGQS
jgi:RNA polymerase sigma factor (sigma-70 family)